jgi:amiloride-sensitive sodium channel
MICPEKSIKLNHKKPYKKLDMLKILDKNCVDFQDFLAWKKSTDPRTLQILTDDGLCETFNAIDANLIFRNDTVDPKFIEEYQERRGDINPVFWSMEEGYTSNTDNYPYRAYDGKSKALKFRPSIKNEKFNKDIDQGCNRISENFKIVVSHPAEVPRITINRMAPFNKSVVVLVKPKVTRTSESLKSIDPNV